MCIVEPDVVLVEVSGELNVRVRAFWVPPVKVNVVREVWFARYPALAA